MAAETERHVHSIASGLSVLDAFDGDEALGLAELHRRTGLTRSRILRIAGTLMANGYLDYNEKTKSYRLGLKLFRFGKALSRRFQKIGDFVRPSLERLAEGSGDTAFYSIVQGDSRLVVAKAESREGIRFFVAEGESRPLLRGATGKVMLAGDDPATTEKLVARLLESTDNQGVEAFMSELARIREAGFCESRGEVTAFGFALAVPLRTYRDQALHVDALTIAGPLAKLDETLALRHREMLFAEKALLEKAL